MFDSSVLPRWPTGYPAQKDLVGLSSLSRGDVSIPQRPLSKTEHELESLWAGPGRVIHAPVWHERDWKSALRPRRHPAWPRLHCSGGTLCWVEPMHPQWSYSKNELQFLKLNIRCCNYCCCPVILGSSCCLTQIVTWYATLPGNLCQHASNLGVCQRGSLGVCTPPAEVSS